MFIGHYGVAFAVKSAEKRIPLWLLFLAVQFVDVLWGVLVLLGVEKARITQEYHGSLPLDLYYMPYTHSLPAERSGRPGNRAAFTFAAFRGGWTRPAGAQLRGRWCPSPAASGAPGRG